MKTMTVGEFKTHFSDVTEQVKGGIAIAITYGRKKEVIGYFVPESGKSKIGRKLGALEGKANVVFQDDFKISESDFLKL